MPETLQTRYDAALADLTAKQRRFVVEYLACLNATEAARRAKYSTSTASEIGWENLRKPQIAEAIAAGLALQAMPAEEVLARLALQARGDMGDFLQEDIRTGELRLNLLAARDAGKLGLIKKYSVDKDGKETIELYSAQAALELLGKHHRLFIERTEVTGADGAPLKAYIGISPDDWPEPTP